MPPRAILPLALAAALPLHAGCRESAREPRVNVLLISLDSVRRDLVGAYGARLPHALGRSPSPNLDRLAQEGVLFEDALATSSWTLPSHATLLTGMPELAHALEQDGQRIALSIPTLAEILRDAGYRTAGVYSGPYLDPRFGFERGFERYRAGYGPGLAAASRDAAVAAARIDALDPADHAPGAREAVEASAGAQRALELASQRDSSSRVVTELALEEIDQAARGGRPFFLFAHYFDPHYDYVPPAPFDRAFDPDYEGALDGRDFFRDPRVSEFDASSPSGRRRVVDERGLEHLRALQAGELAWVDSEIGRLLDELERRGLAATTLVVVVSDHGDEFFEHGSIGHRQTLFEEVLRVPLIARLPGALPAGRRIAGPVALSDVLPTVLELLGLERPEALLSRSLLPRLSGAPGSGYVARLIRLDEALLHPEVEAADVPVRGWLVRVLESWREGSLEILREKSFTRASGPLPPATAAALEERSRRRFAQETLRWIDLELHPGEREEDWSADFGEPRARAALLSFRNAYEALARERARPPLAAEAEDLLAVLRGLGYAGEEAPLGALASEELVLPLPGEGVLGSGGGR